MKHTLISALCGVALAGALCGLWAAPMLSLNIGTMWPQALLATGIPSGDAEIEYGLMIDKKVAFGVAGDFLWNVRSQARIDASTDHYKITSEKKAFMFPAMGFLLIDPVPFLIVHPVAHVEIGYNSMYYVNREDTTSTNRQGTVSPYFMGLIVKAGADGLYNMGERSALFLGIEYQWAGMQTTQTASGFDKLDMSGIEIRAGIRVLL